MIKKYLMFILKTIKINKWLKKNNIDFGKDRELIFGLILFLIVKNKIDKNEVNFKNIEIDSIIKSDKISETNWCIKITFDCTNQEIFVKNFKEINKLVIFEVFKFFTFVKKDLNIVELLLNKK